MPVTVNIRRDNLSASTKTGNLLADTDLQQMPFDGVINVYGVSSAVGVNIEMGVGAGKAITDREIVFIGTTIDRSAHNIVTFEAVAGDNLSLFLRETAAVATTDVILIIEALSADELG
jgi:hypothetical protein